MGSNIATHCFTVIACLNTLDLFLTVICLVGSIGHKKTNSLTGVTANCQPIWPLLGRLTSLYK